MISDKTNAKLVGRSVLLVCSDWPWPPNYAARIDILDRIQVLRELGLTVDIITTASHHHGCLNPAKMVKEVNECYVVQRKSGFLDSLGFFETGQEYSRRLLSSVQLTRSYDFVILEGHYVSRILLNPTLNARHKILRVHNDERHYFLQLANSEWSWKSIYYLLESLRFLKTYPALMKKIPTWMFISAKESLGSQNFANHVGARNIFLPPRVDITNFSRADSNSMQVLFLGTLLMPNNLEAVRWYIRNVHPKLLDIPGYKFCVAGNNSNFNQGGAIGHLLQGVSEVILVANPQETSRLYEESAVFVNPMRNGAGLKLKTVHALAAGLPVDATSIGAEGTRMRHAKDIYQTDHPDEFAKYVRKLLLDKNTRKKLVTSSQDQLQLHYQQSNTLSKLLNDLLESEGKD